MSNTETAGFIITNNEVIWTVAETEDAAWAAFHADAQHTPGTEAEFHAEPATAALLAEVNARGGAISWGTCGTASRPIACTNDEEDAFRA